MVADSVLRQPHVLREYAFLADGERGALVGPRGDISWLCVPGWDSDALFHALVGGPGVYAVTPVDRYVWGGHYDEGSLIWNSRWLTNSAVIECREALAFPGDPHRAVLLRRIRALRGDADVEVELAPSARFGSAPLTDIRHTGEIWEARSGAIRLRWGGAARAVVCEDGASPVWRLRLRVPAGYRHDLVLELSDRELPEEPADAEQCWTATEFTWQREMPALAQSAAPRDTAHAYAVLRGMTGRTGGMVAAATTSLPERAEQGGNYDYRYVWIRDQCIAGQAVAAAGPHPLLDDAVRFTAERLLTDGPKLAPAYTMTGGQVPRMSDVAPQGYPGGGSALVGNRVRDQFQLDVFGEALLLFAAAARHDRLTEDHRRAVGIAVEAIAAQHDQPDAGIWELDDEHWIHSKLACAAGLRAVAAAKASGADIAFCTALADRLVAAAAEVGMHPTGRWQRSPVHPEVDAALLLPLVRGALAIEDPRNRATFDAVHRELSTDYYVYRYRRDSRPLEQSEGAFLLCGFAMAMAADELGLPVTAARYFERNRAACGTPGLFAEEFDVTQRQLRGNLPQAFVHALLFEASNRAARPGQWADPDFESPVGKDQS
ncbi:glycoside hydrolase family 15 protein [Nocardia sp. CDC160]|uniref:glycoside hydrolase family 15 protein n=1 Tax=Nocardia sp. CDC160 TaxID=3112166 RepID=UPI002DC01D96|nr:glycoside hydrolase family 15 protein [Nocardia sp. CDC160]MEC3919011.1 glycoside hydrolase family 15 protein [Nocardia sp. CDC160]